MIAGGCRDINRRLPLADLLAIYRFQTNAWPGWSRLPKRVWIAMAAARPGRFDCSICDSEDFRMVRHAQLR